MKAYIVDAFSDKIFGGNQAGVVILDGGWPEEKYMLALAGELKHSETAFLKKMDGGFEIRYFTSAFEVPLCGHATIGASCLLSELGLVPDGSFKLLTKAGELEITVKDGVAWTEMAPPKTLKILGEDEAREIYAAFGLAPCEPAPALVYAGLNDIILPVSSHDELDKAKLDEPAVLALSKKHEAISVHMFCVGGGATACCRDFAPICNVPEECATGTANAALTWYMYENGLLKPDAENLFIQGEAMGRPSRIMSRLEFKNGAPSIKIGGRAAVSMELILR